MLSLKEKRAQSVLHKYTVIEHKSAKAPHFILRLHRTSFCKVWPGLHRSPCCSFSLAWFAKEDWTSTLAGGQIALFSHLSQSWHLSEVEDSHLCKTKQKRIQSNDSWLWNLRKGTSFRVSSHNEVITVTENIRCSHLHIHYCL